METTIDMTKGSPGRLILRFGLPLLFGNILQQLYNFVDTVVVGRGAGLDALAAVGSTGSIHFLILGFIIGLTQGVSILSAQYFGARQPEFLRKSITMSALLCFGSAALLSLMALLAARPLLVVMQTPENILDKAVLYIQIVFLGIEVSTAYNFFAGILRGLGDSRNPLVAMVLAFVINTALDIYFVMSLKMGVAGAAWATVIAQICSALYCLWALSRIDLLSLHRKDWKWDSSMFFRSLKLSLPVAIMNSITAVGVMVLQMAINQFGSLYIAGYAAATKVIIILEQISSTFGFAAGTYAGQNLGAGLYDRIVIGVRRAVSIVTLINLGAALFCLVFGQSVLTMMMGSEEPAAIEIATHCLQILSVFMLFLGGLWVYRCSLQSMGDTFWPMVSGLLEFASRLVFVLFLPSFFGFTGILLAEASAWITAMIMLMAVYVLTIRRLRSSHP